MDAAHSQKPTGLQLFGLALLTTGVVYGDIGTSVLYSVNEIFFGHTHLPLTWHNVAGAISLSIWALTLVITVKYVCFVLYADDHGEGGIFALFGKLMENRPRARLGGMGILLILAAGLLYGDGMITPAISVLSAVEGLAVITPAYRDFTPWIASAALLLLFLFQSLGTSRISFAFSPIMVLWFSSIGAMGAHRLAETPEILWAINPYYAITFLVNNDLHTNLMVLGSVMLVVTGGEALYADMGHFGRRPIQVGWMILVYPTLLLNYLGQGAYLHSGQEILQNNVFYSMAPSWTLYPIVVLATAATIIASQALITGAFSMTAQANALGLLPRFRTLYTSSRQQGQIYLPFVNRFLLIGCLYLVLVFSEGRSTNLAGAYGLAVAGVMLVTSLAMGFVARQEWGWSIRKVALIFGLFAALDAVFLLANSLKFLHGGYLPLVIGFVLFVIMAIWRKGRLAMARAYERFTTKDIEWLIGIRDKGKEVQHLAESGLSEAARSLEAGRSIRFLERGSVFMSSRPVRSSTDLLPVPMRIFLKRYGAIAEEIIILHVQVVSGIPFVDASKRHEVIALAPGITSLICHYGFREDVYVERDLDALESSGRIRLDEHQWTIEVGENELEVPPGPGAIRRLMNWLAQRLRSLSMRLDGSTEAGSAPPGNGYLSIVERAQFRLYRLLERQAVALYEHFGLEGLQISKIVIPVVFTNQGASIAMPDLEIPESAGETTVAKASNSDTPSEPGDSRTFGQ